MVLVVLHLFQGLSSWPTTYMILLFFPRPVLVKVHSWKSKPTAREDTEPRHRSENLARNSGIDKVVDGDYLDMIQR